MISPLPGNVHCGVGCAVSRERRRPRRLVRAPSRDPRAAHRGAYGDRAAARRARALPRARIGCNPGFDLVITLENGQLISQATGQAKAPIFAEAENKFFLKAANAQIEFVSEGGARDGARADAGWDGDASGAAVKARLARDRGARAERAHCVTVTDPRSTLTARSRRASRTARRTRSRAAAPASGIEPQQLLRDPFGTATPPTVADS